MPKDNDEAQVTEAETVERYDNDGNPVDETGAPLTQEQQIQATVGETTDPTQEDTDGEA